MTDDGKTKAVVWEMSPMKERKPLVQGASYLLPLYWLCGRSEVGLTVWVLWNGAERHGRFGIVFALFA